MKHIEQQLSLDMVEISHNVVNARENDKLIRDLDITLTEKGYSYPIQLGAYVYIRGKRADGKSVFYSADIVDQELGKIHVNIHDYLLSVSGRCTLDIGIYNRIQTNPGNVADEIVSTEPFILYVPNGVFDENDVVNSDEGSALAKLINSARDEIAEMNALEADVANNENIRQYSETERQKNESTRKNNETARITNESDRNNAENERKNNEIKRNNAENVRKENEARRQSDTSSAIERANDAADKAEQKANDLQNKLDNHEIVLADDLQLHNSSLTAHNDVRDLISCLSVRLNALADSDDTTLDQLSEIVAYIKNNKSLIDGVTTSKVNKSGDTMTGKLNAYGGISLNDTTTSSNLEYVLGCDAFVQGGTIRYQNASDLSVGSALNADKLDGLHKSSFLGNNTNFIRPNHIGGSDNANDYTEEWHGFVYNMSNLPTGESYGFFDVTLFDGSGFSPSPPEKGGVVRQIFTSYNSGTLYTRTKVNNIWGSWSKEVVEGSIIVSGNQFGMIDNEGRKRIVMQTFGDGSGTNNYGSQLLIGAAGNTFIGSGESPIQLYSALQTEANKKENELYSKASENMFISSDGHLYLYSNANSVANRKGIRLGNDGVLIPVGKDIIALGSSNSPFNSLCTKSIYITDNSASGIMFGDESAMIYENENRLYINASKGIESNYGSGNAKNNLSKGNKFSIDKNFTGYDSSPHLQLTNSSYPNAKIEMKVDQEGSNVSLYSTTGKLFEIDTCDDKLRAYTVFDGYIRFMFNWNGNGSVYVQQSVVSNENNSLTIGDSNHRFNQIWSTNALNSVSDKNLKKDIKYLSEDNRYLNFFMLLQPKSYLFKDGESGRTHIGFISQDVEEAMAVCGLSSLEFAGFCKDQIDTEDTPDGNPVYIYSLRYEEFIALNTMMIQKLYKKNETLEERVSNLEDKIS